MKNILNKIRMKYAGLLIVVLLTSVGCERPFLEPWPPDGARTPKEIWEFYAFSRGILYRVMGEHQFSYNLYSMTGPAMLATATDEAEHTLSQNLIQSINDGSWSPARSVDSRYGGTISHWVRSPWYNSYMGIRKLNLFLDDLDNSPIINNPAVPHLNNERDIFRGTAFFLRAFLNFELFRAYGSFVILDEVLYPGDNLIRPRNTMKECYEWILEDLDNAIELLPFIHADLNWYMPTKTIVQMQKTVLQLYYASPLFQGEDREQFPFGLEKNQAGDLNRWNDVVASARATIQENSFHNLMTISKWNRPYSDANTYFARLAGTNYPVQIETIWGTTWYGQAGNSYINERNSLPDGEEGCNGLTNPTQNLVDAYEVVQLQASGRPVVGATAESFSWNNDVHKANPYANRDPRFYFTVIHNGTLWGTSTANRYIVDTYDPVSPYPGGKHRDYSRPNHTKTGYYYRKWIPESFHRYITGNFVNFGRVVPHYRFAELLLIYAEAMNEAYGGPDVPHPEGALRSINTVVGAPRTPSTAREALNCVRARVGMPDIPAGLSQQDFREALRHERRIELSFEDKRFWDARRWKLGPEIIGATIHGIKITPTAWDTGTPQRPTSFTYEKVTVEDRYWQDKMYWHPIPYEELVKYAGVIKQNPQW